MLKNNESKLKKATGFICKLLTDGTFNTQNHAMYRMLSYSTILYRKDTYKHLLINSFHTFIIQYTRHSKIRK